MIGCVGVVLSCGVDDGDDGGVEEGWIEVVEERGRYRGGIRVFVVDGVRVNMGVVDVVYM